MSEKWRELEEIARSVPIRPFAVCGFRRLGNLFESFVGWGIEISGRGFGGEVSHTLFAQDPAMVESADTALDVLQSYGGQAGTSARLIWLDDRSGGANGP